MRGINKLKRITALLLLVSFVIVLTSCNLKNNSQSQNQLSNMKDSGAVLSENNKDALKQQTQNTTQIIERNENKDDYNYLKGAINNSLNIHLKFKLDGNKLTGSYYYDKYKTDIFITGDIDKVKNISIIEYDANRNQTGKFDGKYVSDDRIEGNWSDKKTSFPFYLELENTKSEIKDKAQSSTPLSGEINKPTLSIDYRVVKKSIANTYNHMIDYDLKFVQLSGTYKGIDAINEYYSSKEKDDFFGEKTNNWFDVPYSYDSHFQLQFHYHADVQYGNILSISGGGNFWAGGVNNPTIYSDVFDLNTGKKLSLSDVFKISKDEYLNLIYDEVSKSINKEIANGQNRYNFEDAYSTEGKTAIAKFQPENFYFTGESLVVFYPKYTLGIGASGTFEFDIPLDLIKSKLKIDISEKQLL